MWLELSPLVVCQVSCHKRAAPFSGQRGQHDLAGGACQNAGTSKRRRSSEPSGKLIDHLRSAHYMPNRLLAPVEYAQAAIKSVAI